MFISVVANRTHRGQTRAIELILKVLDAILPLLEGAHVTTRTSAILPLIHLVLFILGQRSTRLELLLRVWYCILPHISRLDHKVDTTALSCSLLSLQEGRRISG